MNLLRHKLQRASGVFHLGFGCLSSQCLGKVKQTQKRHHLRMTIAVYWDHISKVQNHQREATLQKWCIKTFGKLTIQNRHDHVI